MGTDCREQQQTNGFYRQQKIAAFGLSTRQRPIVSMSRSVQEQLDRLMRTAARRQEAPVRLAIGMQYMCHHTQNTVSRFLLIPIDLLRFVAGSPYC